MNAVKEGGGETQCWGGSDRQRKRVSKELGRAEELPVSVRDNPGKGTK